MLLSSTLRLARRVCRRAALVSLTSFMLLLCTFVPAVYAQSVSLFAGSTLGYINGIGGAAQFNQPNGICTDPSGNIYVADLMNHRIRKIDAVGNVTLFAGTGVAGFANGLAASAQFNQPAGVCSDASGNIYVAEYGGHRIRKIDLGGNVTTHAGTGVVGFNNGTSGVAQFNQPTGVCADAAGNIYVADFSNHCIRKIDLGGNVTTYAGTPTVTGAANGAALSSGFHFPHHLCIDGAGNIYIADRSNHLVRKINAAGTTVSSLAGNGVAAHVDGPGTSASFDFPISVCVDAVGNVYVSDFNNNRIRRIDPSSNVTTYAGLGTPGTTNGDAASAQFSFPHGVSLLNGSLYVVDRGNERIRKIDPPTFTSFTPMSAYPMQKVTITGTNFSAYTPSFLQAQFGGITSPGSMRFVNATTIEAAVPYGAVNGNVTLIGSPNSPLNQPGFTVNPIPQVTTIAGFGAAGYADGAGALAQFNYILGMVRVGNDLFLTEWVNNRIRRINLTTGLVTTFAGDGTNASLDGTGTSARFAQPVGICSDGTHLYVSEQGGSSRIRRIVIATGVVTTIAGNGNGFADGTGAGAQFDTPSQICYDAGTSSLYLSDRANHRIRRITLGGVVTTLAGNGTPGALDGTGAGATFNLPGGICSDGTNLFVSEQGSHRIRKIVIGTGEVTTIAGSTLGSADGAGLSAQFNAPGGLVMDAAGNLYVADTDNGRVRRISKATGMVTTVTGNGTLVTLDGIPSVAQIARPHGIWYDNASDQIYLGEISSANAVRKIDFYRYTYASGDAGLPASWQRTGPVNALDFNNTASSFTVASGTAAATTGFTLGASVEMLVKNGATLRLNNALTNNGIMAVENGATLEVSNGVTMTNSGHLNINNGATGGRLLLMGTGALAGTSPVYGDAVLPNNATLESGGAAAKTLTAVELPSPMLARLVVSNTVGATIPAAPVIGATGTVTVNSGGRLIIPNGGNLQHNNATALSFTVNSGGFVEIQDAGVISSASSTLNYVAGSTLQYSGTAAKTTTTQEFPAAMGGNLLVTNTNILTLNAAKTLGASATLTLNGGRLLTTGVNMLTVSNTAPTAIAVTTGYVDGPLQRDMAANLTGTAGTYLFPVGVGADKYPFKVLDPFTGATGPRVQVQAFVGNAMGMVGTDISSLSTTEYWQLQQISGNYTSGRISVERTVPMPYTVINSIGGNPATANGTYNNNNSAWAAGNITTNGGVVGAGYFLVGIGPNLYDWVGGMLGDWQAAGSWYDAVNMVNRGTPAATDRLRFNAGTFAPTNIPSQNIQQLIIGGDVTLSPGAAQTLAVGTGGISIPSGNSLTLGNNMVLTQAAVGATMLVGGTLNTGTSYVNGAGNFTLAASGTLVTSRADGINGNALAQGAVQFTGPITYTAGASYSFNSSVNAINTRFAAVGGKPAVTANPIGTLTAIGTNDITLDANATVNTATNINTSGAGAFQTGAFTLTQGASATLTIAGSGRLRLQTGGGVVNNNASGTSFTVQNMGILEIQNSGSVTGSSDVNYAVGATLEYSGTAVKTTTAREIGAAGAQNVLITNTMPVTLGANALVVNSLSINAASKLVLSNVGNYTLSLNGTLNQNGGANIASVNGANAGSISLGGTGALALRLDPTDNTLNNLTVNRAGNHTITGDLNVRGTLDFTNGILEPTTRIFSGDPSGTAAGTILNGTAGSFVRGKLQRRLTGGIVAPGTNYAFPIGAAAGFRPATLVNTLTGASPVIEAEVADAGAVTFDATMSSFLSQRNWRLQTMSGVFNGTALTLTESGLSLAYIVGRSAVQAGQYTGFGGNGITMTTITSNAGAVPPGVNHFFAIGSIQPTVSSFTPLTVFPGDTISITGTALGGVTQVGIGGFAATSFQIVSPTLIKAVVGAGGSGLVTLISPAGAANSTQMITFNNAPEITSFSPSYGTTGSTVQIQGNRLSNPINVSFGGLNALSFVSGGANAITARVNLGNSGPVTVQTPTGIAASPGSFDFVQTPSIVNFFPKWARAGDTVNIFGGNFPRVSGVNFGTSAYTQAFTPVTNGQIRITVPNDASTGLIRAQTPGVGTDSLGTFTMVRPPTISSAQPGTFLAFGQTLTILGTEFHPLPIVRIGTLTAATLEWTSLTEMRATFTQATVGNLTVIASGGTVTAATPMQVIPPPTITSFAPESPLPGELVTVTGANFIANLLTVRVNGILIQTVQRQNDNRLTFTMPPATTGGPMLITSIGGSTTTTITFQPLTITRTQPQSQLIGQEIIITGTRFTGVTAVRFGGINVAPTQYTVLSPTQIRVRVPAGVTTNTISVVGAAGTGTFTGFTVIVPTPIISSFAPTMARSGDEVTITGENFTAPRHVSFGGATAAQFTVVSPTQIRATVPLNASSGSISVVNASGTASRQGFVLIPPVVDPNAALSKFPTFNGSVFAIAVNGAGTIVYVGGDFTETTNSLTNGGNTLMRSRLAAIDANTGALITTAIPSIGGVNVRAIAVDNGNNTVYVGGEFTTVNGGTVRNHLCRFNASTGVLDSWQTQHPLNQFVNGLSLNAANTVIYAVGGFTGVAGNPGWNNGCGFNTVDGTLSGFVPNIANVAQAVVVDNANGSIKVAGHFAQTNGIVRQNRLANLTPGAQDIPSWDAQIQDGVGLALALDGGTTYVGGNFTSVGGTPRSKFCALPSANGNPVIDWNPNMNNDVWAIAVIGANVYAGGTFTSVNGNVQRNALAGFPKAPSDATVTAFNANLAGGDVRALAASGTTLYVGGAFTSVGGQPRRGFAVFTPGATPSGVPTPPSTTVPIVTSFAPESAAPMQSVTITGTRFTGATKVAFGDKEAWFKVVSATEIQTVVPFGAVSGEVRVTKGMETGSRAGFTVLDLPKVSTIVGNGTGGLTNFAGQAAELNFPRFGAKIGNNVYFSMVHAIRRLNVQTGEVSTVAGSLDGGNADGVGVAAQFNHTFGLLPSNEFGGDGSTHLLVADYIGSRMRIVDIASGAVRLFAGTGEKGYLDGSLPDARFISPLGLARDNRGPIILTDQEAHAIRVFLNATVFTYAGNPGEAGSANGASETEALFNGPSGIVVDNQNYAYVADRGGNTIRKIWMENGTVTTLAGTGEAGFADGTSGTAKFNNPMGLALNGTTLFVADLGNHRIRAVSTITGEVVTVAGSGTQGFADGTTQAAQFNSPHSLLWDNGALLVFDTDNHRIRRVEVGSIVFAAPVTTGTMGMTGATVVAPAPMRITDVEPTTVTEGSPITLTGENISTNANVALSSGSIESLPLEIISRSTTAIVVQVPNNIVPSLLLSTSARLVVTTPTVRVSILQRLRVNARDIPSVSIMFPNIGSTQSVVSIFGQHFAPLGSSVRGSVKSVSIGGVRVGAFAVVLPTMIQVTVGSVRSGKIMVETLTETLEGSNLFTLDTTSVPVVVTPPEPVSSKDSLALNRLFASTGGMQWTTTSNWTNGAPIGVRYGVTVQSGRVVELRLPDSGIQGAIPMEVLESLDALKVLDLRNNKLSGAIPPSLVNAKNLEVLRLANNGFAGGLPREMKTMTKLREIDLSGNAIRDSLSSLSGLPNVTVLNLRGNSFGGKLADAIPQMTALTVLDMTGNRVTGEIPNEIAALTQLQVLRMRGNRLTGNFPMGLVRNVGKAKSVALQAASDLDVLDLGNNNLTGPIPDEIKNLQFLRVLLLDSNAFTGDLPASLRTLSRLRHLDIRNNQLSGIVDLSGATRLDTVAVSNNRFSVAMLEYFVGTVGSNRTLLYLPQAPFAQPRLLARVGAGANSTEAVVTVTLQDSLRLSVPKTEVYSRTQWRKNGAALTTLRDASRHADLIIPAFTMADTGSYDCVITNDRLPEITLATAQVQVLGRNPLTAPPSVALLEPGAGELDVSTVPRFRWTSVPTVERYRLEIAADTAFASVLSSATIPNTADLPVAGAILASQQTLPAFFRTAFPLAADRQFAWRVRAENVAGESPWAVGTFTTLPPNAQLTMSEWNFGKLTRFDETRGTIRLQNLGSAALTIESIKASIPDFTIENPPQTVAAGAEVQLPIRFVARKVGPLSDSITVSFRVGMSANVQERTLQNRLQARVSGVRLVAPAFDTVIVGKNRISSAMLINLEDRPITLQRAALANAASPYRLDFQGQEVSIAPRDTVLLRMTCLATTVGTVQSNTLRCITYNVSLDQLRREDLETTEVELQTYARLRTPEDVFVQVGVRALDDNVAPGSAVRLEIYLQSDKPLDAIFKAAQPRISGRLRMNNQVLVLAPDELGLRRLNAPVPSADGLQGYVLPPTFWQGRSRTLAQIRCLAVAGTTATTALVLESLEWGEGSVTMDSLINGSFTVKVSQAGGKRLIVPSTAKLAITAIAPNPATNAVEIAYSLGETGFVEIVLVNAKGETVHIFKQEVQSGGEHLLQTRVDRLPSGSYTVQIRMNGETDSRQVQIVR